MASLQIRRRGLIVLISDLLASVERLEPDLGYLCAGGHDVVVFHILDPAEVSSDFDKPALFQDVETGRDLYVDPAAAQVARSRYGCLTPWERDPATYARAALTGRYRTCEREVVAVQGEGHRLRLLQRNPSYVLQIGETTVAVDRDITDEIFVKRA